MVPHRSGVGDMVQKLLTSAEVDSLFWESEGKTTVYQGKEQNPEGEAHALARHYLITNSGLAARIETAKNGSVAMFSAFITRKDMVAAALALLNSPVGLWARGQLFDEAATGKRPRGSHTGMRAAIDYFGPTKFQVRYPGGEGVMPTYGSKMYLDRIDMRGLKLHIHTFYPLPGQGLPSKAIVKYRDGKQFSKFP
jgi:hypothetical protein